MRSLTDNRLKHIRAVAEYMYEHADGNEDYKQEMYTLGIVHDIGYISGIAKGHSDLGGQILKRQGYKYWKEVAYHGHADTDGYESKELDLLNSADLQINSHGEYIGYDNRLKDIKERYGETSNNYINTCRIVERLRKRGK